MRRFKSGRRFAVALCALVAIAVAMSGATLRANAQNESFSFCDRGSGVFEVDGSGFTPNTALLIWTGWDATQGAGSDVQPTNSDASGNFTVTFPSTELPTQVEATDANYAPLAGPSSVGTSLGSCTVAAGPPSVATSTVTPSVNPATLPADGTSTSTITVQLKDANGHNLTSGGQSVTVSTTGGTFPGSCQNQCAAHDNGDGTYTATLTAPSVAGTATITGYLNSVAIANTASMQFTQVGVPLSAPTLVSTPSSISAAPLATFSFTGSSGTTFQCSVDGAAYAACTSPFTTTSLADGAHTFSVEQASSALPHVVSPAATYGWTIDTVAPATPTIATYPASTSKTATGAFTFSGAASGTTFQCSVDGGAYAACTSPFTTASLADGTHTFAVEQVKTSNGLVSTPATYSWTVDTTPPVAPTITAGPAASTTATSASFTFTGETGATFQCSIDGGAFATCVSPVTVDSLAVGSHTFQVKATDAAGNTGSVATGTWTITTATPPPSAGCNLAGDVHATQDWKMPVGKKNANVHLELEGNCDYDKKTGDIFLHHAHVVFNVGGWPVAATLDQDGKSWGRDGVVTGVNIASDSDAVVSGTYKGTPFTITLHDGGHGNKNDTVDIEYGSLDTSTLSTQHGDVNIHLDNPPAPAGPPTISSGPDNSTTDTSATFAFAHPNNSATFLCSLDGAPFAACESGVSYDGLSIGKHTFQVRATNAGGNGPAATWSWTVTAPPTPPASSVCNQVGDINGDATFTWVDSSHHTHQARIHVDADCDPVSHGHGVFLQHGQVIVSGDSPTPVVSAQTSSISSVAISGSNATVSGTFAGMPFTVALHNAGNGHGDTVSAQVGSWTTGSLTQQSANVSISNN